MEFFKITFGKTAILFISFYLLSGTADSYCQNIELTAPEHVKRIIYTSIDNSKNTTNESVIYFKTTFLTAISVSNCKTEFILSPDAVFKKLDDPAMKFIPHIFLFFKKSLKYNIA